MSSASVHSPGAIRSSPHGGVRAVGAEEEGDPPLSQEELEGARKELAQEEREFADVEEEEEEEEEEDENFEASDSVASVRMAIARSPEDLELA